MSTGPTIPARLRRIWWGSIRRQWTIGFSLLIGVAFLLFLAHVLARQREFLYRRNEEQGRALAQALAHNSPSWVLASDVQGLGELLHSVKRYPDLDYAMVLTPEGRVLAHTDSALVGLYASDPVSRSLSGAKAELVTLSDPKQMLDVAAPVMEDGHIIGWVRVGIRDDQLRQNLATILREGLLYGLIAVGLGALLAAFFARGLTRGLNQLVDLTRKVAKGQEGVRVSLGREDELGTLGEAFDAMTLELQRSAKSLRDSRAHLLQLLENLPVAVAVFGADRTLGYANPMAQGFLCPDLQKERADDPHTCFLREDGSPMGEGEHPVDRVLRLGRPVKSVVIGIKAPPGEDTRWAFVNAYPESDEGGALNRVIVCFVDITERLKVEQENRRLGMEVEHAHRLDSLGNLAGGVAHDMNNILAAILGLASVHKGTAPPGTAVAKAFSIIESAGLRGRDLVKHLLDFARKGLEGARIMDLNDLVREEVDLLARTTLKRAEWAMDLQEPLNPVNGDSAALGNAIINLCVNAVDAMERGGLVTIRTRNLPGGGCSLEVEDTGAGMAPEVCARALDPFFTTKVQGKGTGLGLSIVYGTMKAHGGSIELASTPGKGTRVRLLFPPPLQSALGKDGQETADATGLPPRVRPALRILLVDDDDWVRDATTPMLQMLGHEVIAVDSGRAALDQIQRGLAPDLVILDQNMPGLSGTETLARILKERPAQQALLASGAGQPYLGGLPPGANVRYIPKPFTLEELISALDSRAPG